MIVMFLSGCVKQLLSLPPDIRETCQLFRQGSFTRRLHRDLDQEQ
jgi:hypothetical protein